MAGSSANKLKLEVTLGTDGLVQGINVAGKSVENFKQNMKFKMPVSEMKDYTSTLKDFKYEQVQNARLSRFFGNELASIVPGADAAGGALRKVASIFASGFGIGMAFEGTKVVLETIAERINEQDRLAKELRNTYRDTGHEIASAMRGVERELDGSVSRTSQVRRAIADKTREEMFQANKEVQELLSHAGGVRDFFNWLSTGAIKATGVAAGIMLKDVALGSAIATKGVDMFAVKSIDATISEKQAALNARTAAVDAEKRALDAVQEKETSKREKFLQQELSQIYASSRDEVLRIERDKQGKLLELEFQNEYTAAQKAEKRVAIESDAARKVSLLRQERTLALNSKLVEYELQYHDAIERESMQLMVRSERAQLEMKKAGTKARVAELQAELDADSAATAKKISLMQADEAAQISARMAILEAERTHADAEERIWLDANTKIADIKRHLDAQASDEEIARARAKIAVIQAETTTALQKMWEGKAASFIDPLVQSWQSGFEEMLTGTYQWSNLTRNIFLSVGESIAKGVAQMAAQWIGEQAKMFIATTIMKGQEVATHVAGEATKTAVTTASAEVQVGAQAAVAGAAAAATAAETPGIGWMIAVPAAAAVVAGVLGLKSLIHASGGMDVPSSGHIPLAQLHHSEMVLPAKFATPLRKMLTSGGDRGDVSVNLHLNALDGTSARRFLREQGREAILDVVREALRDNRM